MNASTRPAVLIFFLAVEEFQCFGLVAVILQLGFVGQALERLVDGFKLFGESMQFPLPE